VALLYFYLTLGFESSTTWQSREQLIEAVSIGTRQADFDAKSSFFSGLFQDAVSILMYSVEVSGQEDT
jgi:hypothetical protein